MTPFTNIVRIAIAIVPLVAFGAWWSRAETSPVNTTVQGPNVDYSKFLHTSQRIPPRPVPLVTNELTTQLLQSFQVIRPARVAIWANLRRRRYRCVSSVILRPIATDLL